MVELPPLREHHNKIKKLSRKFDSHEKFSQLLFFHLPEASIESSTKSMKSLNKNGKTQ